LILHPRDKTDIEKVINSCLQVPLKTIGTLAGDGTDMVDILAQGVETSWGEQSRNSVGAHTPHCGVDIMVSKNMQIENWRNGIVPGMIDEGTAA